MKIAVLGSSGGMGSYFVRYFLAEGHQVVGSDIRKTKRAQGPLLFASSNREAVKGAKVVLISVPIRDTVKIAKEVIPNLRDHSIVVEITSVKAGIRRELLKVLNEKNIPLLSIHPLFGPLSTSRHPKICVIGNGGDLSIARSLFPKAEFLRMGERQHDRLVAYALSLVHLLNLAFVSSVENGPGIRVLDRVATPTGAAQLNLAKAVLSQDPSLYSYIELENPFALEAVTSAIEELEGLRKAIVSRNSGQFEKRFASLSRRFARAELDDALRAVYSVPDHRSSRRRA